MSRLIDADAIPYTMLYKENRIKGTGVETLGVFKSDIDNMPTIEERKTGKWVYDENGMDWNIPAWRCSKCGGRNDMIPISTQYKGAPRRVVNPYLWAGSRFCPHCGAKMEDKHE